MVTVVPLFRYWPRLKCVSLQTIIAIATANMLSAALVVASDAHAYHQMTVNFFPSKIGPVCQALKPCPKGSFCRDICYHPGYRCVTCPKYHVLRYEQYCELKGLIQ